MILEPLNKKKTKKIRCPENEQSTMISEERKMTVESGKGQFLSSI